MKILITGAKGYIGSHLVNELAKDNSVHLFCVCNSTPFAEVEANNVTYLKADLSTDDFIKELPEKIDVIIHLAQSNNYRNFPEMAEDIFNVNIRSTQLLLHWSIKAGVKKFIFSSTGNVYKQQNKLLSESDLCEPNSYYGASKYAAEQIIKPYQKYFNVTLLRIFGVYGPGQKNMTVPNIINKVVTNEEISLANNEGLFFTPLYIDDCVLMIIQILKATFQAQNNVYNISGNEKVHLGILVEIISQITSVKPKIKVTEDNTVYLMGDASSFLKEFNYKIKTPFIQGIEQTIKYETIK